MRSLRCWPGVPACAAWSRPALSQRRAADFGRIAFEPLNAELLRLMDVHLPALPQWQGLRVLAADGGRVGDIQARVKAGVGIEQFRRGIDVE